MWMIENMGFNVRFGAACGLLPFFYGGSFENPFDLPLVRKWMTGLHQDGVQNQGQRYAESFAVQETD